ncbi:MAG TPA: glycosyltransferase family 39 protein [Leptospiraceae bacterium]|nr:glycosyltransferase family 39 protein [Leptospiraceae bacterium]HNM03248.1 glycosyltransferase family 39 protein [Leptospiraceae bacterium]
MNTSVFPYIGIITLISVIKLFYALGTELIPDEAYYWEWSRRLDLSFYDQGPGAGLYIRLFTSILGNTNFALKLAAVSAGFGTSVFLIYTSRLLQFGKKGLFWTVLLSQLIPGFFGGSIFIMHDSPLLLSWSAALYFTVHYIFKKDVLSLYLMFLSLGFGALSKHSMVFFALSLIVWLILNPKQSALLKNPHFYAGLILAGAVFSPVILWNIQHHWDNVDAIIHLRSSGGVYSKKWNTGEYIGGQLLAMSPLWFIASAALLFLPLGSFISRMKQERLKYIFLRGQDNSESAFSFLYLNASVLLLYFLFMSFTKHIQANWTFPAYLPMILISAAFLEKRGESLKDAFIFRAFQIGTFFALFFNVFSFFSVPIVKLFNIPLETYSVPGYRQAGFREAAEEIRKLRDRTDPNAEIIANKYQDAAILSWFLPGQPFVQSLNIMQKNQYNYWLRLEKGKNYFLGFIEDKTCEKSFIFFQSYLELMFEEVKEFPEQDILVDGKTVKRYQAWYLKNFRESWAEKSFNYMENGMVYAYMPVLLSAAGASDSKDSSANFTKALELLNSYYSRKGEIECSIFRK